MQTSETYPSYGNVLGWHLALHPSQSISIYSGHCRVFVADSGVMNCYIHLEVTATWLRSGERCNCLIASIPISLIHHRSSRIPASSFYSFFSVNLVSCV